MILNEIFCIIVFCFYVYCAIWNIPRFVYFLKCFKIKKCSNRECKFNSFCDKYKKILTEEEFERLLKMLDERHS